ncbi:MAG: helix-turn-helix domain-containing protein [Phycisphaerales bacterium]|nr:helix-turn-helix domain-containing protein [Phycisphaerales bacterium]
MSAERILPETVPSIEDMQLAQESGQRLSKALSKGHNLRLTAVDDGPEPVEIPAAAAQLLVSLLAEMAKGNAVTLIPIHAKLTTQRVADLLGVSRPFIVKEIEEGRLPGRKVGKHRRVLFEDLVAYKQRMDGDRQQALDELSALDQELGLT